MLLVNEVKRRPEEKLYWAKQKIWSVPNQTVFAMHKKAGFFLNCDMRKTPSAQDLITLFVKWKNAYGWIANTRSHRRTCMQRVQECDKSIPDAKQKCKCYCLFIWIAFSYVPVLVNCLVHFRVLFWQEVDSGPLKRSRPRFCTSFTLWLFAFNYVAAISAIYCLFHSVNVSIVV